MKRIVKKLPKHAMYDYTNIYGEKVYHTKMRVYHLSERRSFGRRIVEVTSQPKD